MELINSLVNLSQGNPGAVSVLVELYKNFGPEWNSQLYHKLSVTDTKGLNLWLIYNDECKRDIGKTQAMLDDWVATFPESLGHWIVAKNMSSAREAAYYLNS